MAALLKEGNVAFEEECQARHKRGAEKYGPVKFLEEDNDLARMLMEELADAANYARYFYVRMYVISRLAGEALVAQADTPLGPSGIVNPYRKEGSSD